MTVTLTGGPYDGTVIDHNGMNLYARFVTAGMRKFLLMPARDRWDLVRESGDKSQGGEGVFYELIGSPIREARYDHNAEQFAAAQRDVQEGRIEMPPAPDWSKYLHFIYLRGEMIQPMAGWSTLTDEKGRRWTFSQQPHEKINERVDTPEVDDPTGRCQGGFMTTKSMEEFAEKLADLID